MSESQDPRQRLAEASRIVTQELHKQGTPEYDHRAHERAVEAERRAAEAVRLAAESESR
ncbi:translation initiation factor 2 [Cellulomonas shaoxiangyii]|uniref:Translation initiation factor 2 n=1 Tax=Cellulomonas shaoxiangyii TaxID=2566013 RepID=A0A4P7SMI6_9CELL|nr:translation initiation factor 2 [Cellulomonas shaoxiangyii]QCB93793.1 translation initiation factor 2 [Cellulomonas shaoxiangyii]TGY84920.1 translation initiation factor 2 [Cellulomonas shaoxiangyii]